MNTVAKRFHNDTFRPVASGQSIGDRIRAALSGLGEFFLNLAASGQEPQIRLTHGRDGQTRWNVYDPTSGYSNSFLSENDVRVWLDNRY